jgi:hypothetical protein
MGFDELWKAEKRFWLDGPGFYEENMAADALMVFPEPVGVLRGEAIVAGLRQGARWRSVEMTETVQTALAATAVLAYRARGQRDGAAPYSARCSSTYVRDGDRWKLLAHQQTPVS